jgi:ESCRT-II complex subunit VPS36
MTSSVSTTATSPVECLPKAELTPSGLLLLDTADGEVELLRREKSLELRSDSDTLQPLSSHPNYKDRIALSRLVLTTHRLVFMEQENTNNNNTPPRFLHLSNVHMVDNIPTSVFSSHYKIRLVTYSLGDLLIVGSKKESNILPDLSKTLERRAWETASRLKEQQQQQTTTGTTLTKQRVGVDAIMATNKRKHERASQVTQRAFTGDVETLLQEATELVAIIQKYAATLSSSQQQQQGNKSSNNPSQKDNDDDTYYSPLADMLQDMGMASALPLPHSRSSGSSSADVYYETLARQLADFIRPKLAKQGGIMTLTDVYCLYNRARGSNLISPQDLCKAVSYFEGEQHTKLANLGLTVKEFPSSKVKVLIDNSCWKDDDITERLLRRAPLTALEASRELNISALLANEALVAAERKGYLCRDVTLETTRFYPNRFQEFSVLCTRK